MAPEISVFQASIHNLALRATDNDGQYLTEVTSKDDGFPSKDSIRSVGEMTDTPVNGFKDLSMLHRSLIPKNSGFFARVPSGW